MAYARPIEHNTVFIDARQTLKEASLQIQREFPDRRIFVIGGGQTRTHPGKMRHAFYNLLKNAVEASKKDSKIEVEIAANKSELNIYFRNLGRPISPEIQPQIFEPFFSTKPDGVGLGLSITKSIVEQHGGKINLARSDNSGTEFVITLPQDENE